MKPTVPESITNDAVLEFAVFCIEGVAETLGKSAVDVYHAFTEKSDLLNGYIVPCYDALHTQGKDYIISELVSVLAEKRWSYDSVPRFISCR